MAYFTVKHRGGIQCKLIGATYKGSLPTFVSGCANKKEVQTFSTIAGFTAFLMPILVLFRGRGFKKQTQLTRLEGFVQHIWINTV